MHEATLHTPVGLPVVRDADMSAVGGGYCGRAYHERAQRGIVREAWGDWLSKLRPWSHFATFTFARRVGWWGANRRWDDYQACLFSAPDGQAVAESYALFGEMQRRRGVPHFHTLLQLATVHHIRGTDAVSGWLSGVWGRDNGFARIVPIKSEGAAYYVSKYASKNDYQFRLVDRIDILEP